MRELILTLKEKPDICIEVEGLNPDVVAKMSREEIEKFPIQYGNKRVPLSEFFELEFSESDVERIVFKGDMERVKRIGWGLERGEIVVEGNAGMYLGAFMMGGRIVVKGNVGHFSALNMRGGEVIIEGNAGDYLCASYRGEWRGMSGGTVVVNGDVGKELGSYMRGGRIVVKGRADDFAGVNMRGGLIVLKEAGDRVGASMVGGSIVADKIGEILPGFFHEGEVENPDVEGERFNGVFDVYSGDHAERRAKGKLYVRKS